MDKSRSSFKWMGLVAAGLLAAALVGCSSSDSNSSDSGTPPPVTPPPVTGGTPPPATPPSGTSPITLNSTNSGAVFATVTPVVKIGGVGISSPPSVTFSMADANNNAIIGFGATNKIATATVPSLANLRFSLAKLVAGTNGSPSKWVNYIVTTVPSTTAAAAPRTPTADREGTLVDNKNGTYTYTFYRDVPKIRDQVAAMTVTGVNNKADLGDLTYDPALTHRLTIQVSGDAPGTGNNTPTGAPSGVTAVPLANPINVIYDFVPATGKPVAATDLQREVIVKNVCNECHEKLTLHGSRNETQYCVVCHSDQLKYGSANSASTLDQYGVPKFPALTETKTVNANTGITSYSYTPRMMLADGVSIGDFPVMVHRIHGGRELVKENYNLANVVFDLKGYSMFGAGQKMCTKCHDNKQAAQADNHKNKPSRLACGACHDGINWATGKGSTLGDRMTFDAAKVGAVLAASGHVGGAQSGDATCSLCHSADAIPVYHQTENVTTHNPVVAAGLKNFTYEIDSASVSSANAVTVKFRIRADGTAVTFVPPAATVANPLTGFTGGPSFLLAYAQSQDGVATPADYNNLGRTNAQPRSVSIASLLSTNSAATVGTLSGPDASGYYTANIVAAIGFPAGATMRAVALQGYFTQITAPATATAGIGRHTISVIKSVTGDAVRRTVVASAKCANCHEWFEGHGGNRVYEAQVCVTCHLPGISTSGRGVPDTTMNTWKWTPSEDKIVKEWKTLFGFDQTVVNAALKFPVTTNNFKDMIHGIHAGRERVTPFVDARDRTPSALVVLDFRRMDFPGRLDNCETCHVAGTYSSVPSTALASTYEANNGAVATPADVKTSLASTPNASDVVTTPFAGACVSCHDSNAVQAHIKLNGGQIKVARSALNLTGEACAVCHGPGKGEDPAVVHKR